jgi:hypothetical protein
MVLEIVCQLQQQQEQLLEVSHELYMQDKVNSQFGEAPEVLVAERHGINGKNVVHSDIESPV